jgi:electron transfer flavoprotein beta subunit
MRIVVCVRQVYDPATVKISRSREELDLRGAAKITNRPDRYALEAACQLREADGGEVIALTVGDSGAEDAAHEAVAMGADRALLVTGPELATISGSGVARALAAAIERLGPVDLVLTGAIGLIDGSGGLAARLAALLGWPVILDAVQLVSGDAGLAALIALEGEGRLAPVAGPAVIAVMPGPRRPRWPHAARIANAWRAGLVEICSPAELGLAEETLAPDTEPGGLALRPERTRGQVISGSVTDAAAAVLEILRHERVAPIV